MFHSAYDFRLALLLGGIWIGLWLVPKLFTRSKLENRLLDKSVIRQGQSKQLVVFLHGYGGKGNYLQPLFAAIQKQCPHADIFYPGYRTTALCNSDPEILSAHLEYAIDEVYQDRKKTGGYETVVLMGHSLGGMMARQVYLLAKGESPDPTTGFLRDPKEWVTRVDRIVLTAAMNRGWSISPKARHMSWGTWLLFWFLEKLTYPSGTGRLLKSLKRGSPFVANLRVDWIRMSQKPGASVAPVYQLLGDIDSLVSSTDSMDLVACGNFVFIPVGGSGHRDILDLDDPDFGTERRKKFVEALVKAHSDLEEEYGENIAEMKATRKPKEHVVFMMHGIRDDGDWLTPLRKILEEEGEKRFGPGSVEVVSSKYGYFNMIRFLLFPSRESNVCWFMDRYTEALSRSENPHVKVGYVGHSNGTFILAKALETYRSLKIHHALFAGSVVRNSYPWDNLVPHRVVSLRNDLASSDWVVAWFPKLYAQICDFAKMEFGWFKDLGSAGFNGFRDHSGNRFERYYKGTHSAALQPANFPSIAEFIFSGKVERDEKLLCDKPNGVVHLFSRLSFVVWFVLLLGSFALAHYLVVPMALKWSVLAAPTIWTLYYLIILTLLYFI